MPQALVRDRLMECRFKHVLRAVVVAGEHMHGVRLGIVDAARIHCAVCLHPLADVRRYGVAVRAIMDVDNTFADVLDQRCDSFVAFGFGQRATFHRRAFAICH